jgi:hypothetical protein
MLAIRIVKSIQPFGLGNRMNLDEKLEEGATREAELLLRTF